MRRKVSDTGTTTKSSLIARPDIKKVLFIVCAFMLPILIFTAANCYAMNPLKKLPTSLTMRYAPERDNFILGTAQEAFDEEISLRGVLSGKSDLLSIIGHLFSGPKGHIYFLLAVFSKTGTASLLTALLIRKRIGLSEQMCVVFGTAYALAFQNVLALTDIGASDFMVLLPLVFWVCDIFSRNEGSFFPKLGVLLITVSVLLTGVFGFTYGLVFMAFVLLFTAQCSSVSNKEAFAKFGRGLLLMLAGILVSSPIVLNTLFTSEITYKFKDILSGETDFTFFDFLSSFTAGNAFSLSVSSPGTYIGMFALALAVLFFFIGEIPVRIRVTALTTIVLYHFTYSFVFVRQITSVWVDGSTASASKARFSCVIIFLLFIAAVALRNIRFASRIKKSACVFATFALLILCNVSVLETSMSTMGRAITFFGIIVSALTLLSAKFTEEKTLSLNLAAALVILELSFNMFFCLPISQVKNDSAFRNTANLGGEYRPRFTRCDSDFLLFQESDEIRYIVVSTDLSHYQPESTSVFVNRMSNSLGYGYVYTSPEGIFDVCDLGVETEDFLHYKLKTYDGVPEIRKFCDFEPEDFDGKYLTIFLDSDVKTTLTLEGDALEDTVYQLEGDSAIVVKDYAANYNFSVIVKGGQSIGGMVYGVYLTDAEALEGINSCVKTMSDGKGTVTKEEFGDTSSVKGTVILGIPYSDDLKVTENGFTTKVFDIDGFAAFSIDTASSETKIVIKHDSTEIKLGFVMSLVTLSIFTFCEICIIGINKKQEISSEGRMSSGNDSDEEFTN